MSQYLIERIEAQPNVDVVIGCEISALEGADGVLEAISWRDRKAGTETKRPVRYLFSFIGAEPNTDWLGSSGIKLDERGFVLTGDDVGKTACRWRRAAAACSRSATSDPARSSASRRPSAMERRLSQPFMPIWQANRSSRSRRSSFSRSWRPSDALCATAVLAAKARRMLLAIDAGNTNLVFALVDGEAIKARWRIATRSAAHRRPICRLAAPAARARRLFRERRRPQ